MVDAEAVGRSSVRPRADVKSVDGPAQGRRDWKGRLNTGRPQSLVVTGEVGNVCSFDSDSLYPWDGHPCALRPDRNEDRSRWGLAVSLSSKGKSCLV